MIDSDAHVIEGRAYPQSTGPGAGCRFDEGMCLDRGANPFTVDGVRADADREGIDAMVFFPSVALGLPGYEDQRFAAEVARAYTRWLAACCASGRGRLFGVAVSPIEDVPVSIAIMREAKGLGPVATMLPAVLRRRTLDHPDLEPVYAAAEELDVPLGIHGAPGIHRPDLGSHRFCRSTASASRST